MADPTTPAAPVSNDRGLFRRIAHAVAESWVFSRGRRLLEENKKNWNMPLSKIQKLEVGAYWILSDYSKGDFPPRFEERERAYRGEIEYTHTLPGTTPHEVNVTGMRKPFWFGPQTELYLTQYIMLNNVFMRCGITPPARVLELGCGHGWMSEFLATAGFDVMGTSIAEEDIVWARKRIGALEAKELSPRLRFEVSPMEEVAQRVSDAGTYDVVFVFEALHHAFDWREAIAASAACLKEGGWLLLCNEPNLLHTFISYRVAKLSNTHEIGMSRSALTDEMRRCGLPNIINLSPRLHFGIKGHWLCGQKMS